MHKRRSRPSQCFKSRAFSLRCYSPPQVNLDKQARKLDDLKAQPHAPGPQGKAAKQKKVEKLDRSIKMMLTKELGPMKFKQSLLVSSLGCASDCSMLHTSAKACQQTFSMS